MFRRAVVFLQPTTTGVIKRFQNWEKSFNKNGKSVSSNIHNYTLKNNQDFQLKWVDTPEPLFPVGTAVTFEYDSNKYNNKTINVINKKTFRAVEEDSENVVSDEDMEAMTVAASDTAPSTPSISPAKPKPASQPTPANSSALGLEQAARAKAIELATPFFLTHNPTTPASSKPDGTETSSEQAPLTSSAADPKVAFWGKVQEFYAYIQRGELPVGISAIPTTAELEKKTADEIFPEEVVPVGANSAQGTAKPASASAAGGLDSLRKAGPSKRQLESA